MFFAIGDYLAGMLIGIMTALAVRAIVWPGMDMVIAMLLGMAVGMVVHFVLGLALAPLLGMFETMIPGSCAIRWVRDRLRSPQPSLSERFSAPSSWLASRSTAVLFTAP